MEAPPPRRGTLLPAPREMKTSRPEWVSAAVAAAAIAAAAATLPGGRPVPPIQEAAELGSRTMGLVQGRCFT